MGKTTISDLEKKVGDLEKKVDDLELKYNAEKQNVKELEFRIAELEINGKKKPSSTEKPSSSSAASSSKSGENKWFSTHKTLKACLKIGISLKNREEMVKDFGYESIEEFCNAITNINPDYKEYVSFLENNSSEPEASDHENLWKKVLMEKDMAPHKKKLGNKLNELREGSTTKEAKKINYEKDDPLLAEAVGVDAEI